MTDHVIGERIVLQGTVDGTIPLQARCSKKYQAGGCLAFVSGSLPPGTNPTKVKLLTKELLMRDSGQDCTNRLGVQGHLCGGMILRTGSNHGECILCGCAWALPMVQWVNDDLGLKLQRGGVLDEQ